VNLIRVLGLQFGERLIRLTLIKVKYDAWVVINKNSDPVQKFFLRGGWEDNYPTQFFSKLLE